MCNNKLFPTLIRWAILIILVAAGLLFAAGTTHVRMLNAYIVALAPSLLVMMLAIAPRIAQGRGSPDGGKHGLYDRRARLALVVLFLVTIVMAALDVGRVHVSNNVSLALSAIALVIYIASSGFQAWAISVNSFYSPVIHVQAELGHSVVTRGPYRILRHPAYFANIVAIPASAIAIGSWIALIPATLFCAITAWRARREDAFLKQCLPGYSDYMESVPGGVFPRLSFKL
jgi:protein-S-isoprenylcysteine O-methyltransferase Ste14